jgi:hypothetical protein
VAEDGAALGGSAAARPRPAGAEENLAEILNAGMDE